ncbi:SIS domain-containing protein [Pseudoxanthomonas wuyuanensis]|uniref:Glutamine--fructose-6-phosphate transaminase n=1 Tax=Pseudoxanthomonas wuyuanensis TaxID=1073196 RepID=A0A286DA23_9GAMM|nr:SIS domain-containing protein [Pseudoxanthomonas wuyuanensis]KAF1720507.1 SIS domain-containing protein [Pseudoxanthomonas wuyuanensis]SOD55498.1 glutamine--fructose-6-phosphate transaminase [Pseudoxanthomonas wuyuanensis]
MTDRPALPAETDTLMFQEARQTAEVVATQFSRNDAVIRALAQQLRENPPPFVATCARGSSDHAATYAKYLFETQLGIVTASASPSVGSVYEARQQLKDALYLVISQSGKSPDLLRNAAAAAEAGARVVAIVNAEDSPLAALADTVIPLHAGPERSVAATKSYLGSLAAILQLAAHWKNEAPLLQALPKLPDALRAAWQSDWSSLTDGLADAHNLFVLGRGLGLAAAQEAALKFKETCGLHAEAYSSAEVKHGPMALVGPGFPVLCFAQPDETEAGTLALAREFRGRGAQVWVSSEHGDPGSNPEQALPLAPAPHPACAPLLTIQSFYRAINALALRRGHNPDVPPHLNKVTETV